MAAWGGLKLLRRSSLDLDRSLSLPAILLLALPLPLLHEILSIGGKSFAEYGYFFLAGYLIFANRKTIAVLEKNCWQLLALGLTASLLNVYLFVWSSRNLTFLGAGFKYISQWSMVLALLGLSGRYLDFSGRVSDYMRKRSILFYFYHFLWVVVFQYVLCQFIGNNTWLLYVMTLILSYGATFLCCLISIRIPALCFLTGVKYK